MYVESEQQYRDRKNSFTHTPQSTRQTERYERILDRAESLVEMFNTECPQSRELLLAKTKIEEAVMWANASINTE